MVKEWFTSAPKDPIEQIQYIRKKLLECSSETIPYKNFGEIAHALYGVYESGEKGKYDIMCDRLKELLTKANPSQIREFLLKILDKEYIQVTEEFSIEEKVSYFRDIIKYATPDYSPEELFAALGSEKYIDRYTKCEIAKKETLNKIKFYEKIVQEDLNAYYLSSLLYKERKVGIIELIPTSYKDENGVSHSLEYDDIIDFYCSGNNFVAIPTNQDKLLSVFRSISSIGFNSEKTDVFCRFYKELNFAIVDEGNHTATAAHFAEKGPIKAMAYSIKEMFGHVYTDGLSWYNKHTQQQICDAGDFRICTLYELARLRIDWVDTFNRLKDTKL